jgi:predicted deacylase
VGVSSVDFVDMFHAFPGKKGETVSHLLVTRLFEDIISRSSYVVELHGGEINETETIQQAWFCRTGNAKVDRMSEDLANAFGADYTLDGTTIWLDKTRSSTRGTLLYEAPKIGIPSIFGEAGGTGQLSEQAITCLHDGVLRVCKRTGVMEGSYSERKSKHISRLTILRAKHEGLYHSHVKPGQQISSGQLLAEIRDWKDKIKQKIKAPFDGIVVVVSTTYPIHTGEPGLVVAKQN